MNAEEIDGLIHELLDGTIGHGDFERLQAELHASPEARQRYYDLSCTDQLLVERFSSPRQAMSHRRWSEKRYEGHPWTFSLAAAAAILLLLFATMLVTRVQRPDVRLTTSADARFTIDGEPSAELVLQPDQKLTVQSGMVAARINSATELFLESPAEVVLLESDGSFELLSGRGWVDVKSSAPDFHAIVSGASIRHLGTRYGIAASPGGKGEVHVAQGKVEVRLGEEAPTLLVDGEAARWTDKGPVIPLQAELNRFRTELPSETTLFADDFDDPAGTPFSGKRPDVGYPWMALREARPTYIRNGALDTSGGYRTLSAPFRRQSEGNGQRIFIISLGTTEPTQISDKTSRLEGREIVRLWDHQGSPIFSLIARATEEHRWRLQDGASGDESELLEISALENHALTLRFDPANRHLTIHEGPNLQGRQLASLTTSSSATPVSLTVENDEGGDLALTEIHARSVDYPPQPENPAQR